MKIVLLVGGVGGAKFAYGLMQIVNPEDLTIVVNTGDDFWHYGLRICPDLDTVTYTLSGLVDKSNGWGIGGDTTHTLQALGRLGETPWFRLGDQDIATHLLRTQLWHEGHTLTQITQQITSNLGIHCQILPMTDAPVATMIDTLEMGRLEFQEYFVRHRWQPTLQAIELHGIDQASITPEVEHAIEQADALIIGPSNPWLSINPILSVPGMRQQITKREIPRIAITPIVGGKAIKGPAAKLMRELGYEPSAHAVMEYYRDVINGFVYDAVDDNKEKINQIQTICLNTIMDNETRRVELARDVIHWLSDWKPTP